MSAPVSISDTQLGLTQSELLLFRHHQQLIAQQPAQRGVMVERGRGTSRHSQPSSRAASAASSQSVPGRIVLDPRSLSNLSASLDNLLISVQRRIQEVSLHHSCRFPMRDQADTFCSLKMLPSSPSRQAIIDPTTPCRLPTMRSPA